MSGDLPPVICAVSNGTNYMKALISYQEDKIVCESQLFRIQSYFSFFKKEAIKKKSKKATSLIVNYLRAI